MDLIVRPFTPADRGPYAAWFADPLLAAELGPPWNDEEFARVMAEAQGHEFVVEDQGAMIAVLGVYDPSPDFRRQVLAAIAVDPARRRRGLGRRALAALIAHHPAPPDAPWSAWVDRDNLTAIAFFTGIGWRRVPVDEAMLLFERCGGESR